MGTKNFYPELGAVLAGMGGCEHLHIFKMDGVRPIVISGVSADGSRRADEHFDAYMRARLWDGDVGMVAINGVDKAAAQLFRTHADQMSTPGLRDFFRRFKFAERLLFCSRENSGSVAFTANKVGHARFFSSEEIERLSAASSIVLSLIDKHTSLVDERKNRTNVLASLPAIEARLQQSEFHMPPRERQACARFIYGLSAREIADDLGIAEETVTCYRKRIYQRLSLASCRELLLWYLNLCSDDE